MSASAAASGAGKEALLDQFRRLSENEQCEHILSLLEFVEVRLKPEPTFLLALYSACCRYISCAACTTEYRS